MTEARIDRSKDTFHYIAHRGNLFGPNPERENRQEYLKEAILRGFDVEVDVWVKDGSIFLGHDNPQYAVDINFLRDHFIYIWAHAKNKEALNFLSVEGFCCFWHQDDDYTFTSNSFIWTHANAELIKNYRSVYVNLEANLEQTRRLYRGECAGVCSDWFGRAE